MQHDIRQYAIMHPSPIEYSKDWMDALAASNPKTRPRDADTDDDENDEMTGGEPA